jgi:hypothetical protein
LELGIVPTVILLCQQDDFGILLTIQLNRLMP